jgi:peptide/nickel transport system substrate-binding protein
MITKRRTTRAVGTGLAAVLALAGCSGSPDNSSASKDVILNIYAGGAGSFVENWNPFSPTALSGAKGMIYEALFFFNNLKPLDETPVPVLGKDFRWNADGTVLTVTMRDGIKWSDGQPVTAADAAFTYNTIASRPALNTSGNAPKATASGNTLTLTYKSPAFVDGPNTLMTKIVPEHIWKNIADPEKDINKDPVGSGPYKVGSFTAQSYLLVKSPTYRDADKVEVAGSRYYSLSGNQAATDKLMAGQLDWAGFFIPDMKKVLAAKKNLGYGVNGSQQIGLAACSNAALGCTGPQTDPAVRKAVSAAIDRTQINKLAYYDAGTPISATWALLGRDDAFIDPALRSPEPMQPDLAKAQTLLEGAGWKKGSDGIYAKNGERLRLTCSVPTGWTDYIAALDAMKEQLKAAGIELVPTQQAGAEVTSQVGLGKYQLTMTSLWQGPAADPYYVYNTFFNSQSTRKVGEAANPYANTTRFKSPIVDAALERARATQDSAVKTAAYSDIQKVIVEDLPYIPVLNNVSSAVFDTSRVTGFPSGDNQYVSTDPGSENSSPHVLTRLKVVKK